MKQAIALTAGHINEARVKITAILLWACLITAIFYVVNLYSLISKTVTVEHIDSKAKILANEVSDLDAKYLKLSNSITPDSIGQYGLAKSDNIVYIPRPQSTASIGNLATGAHEL